MNENNDYINMNEASRPTPVKPPMAPQVQAGYNPPLSQAPPPRREKTAESEFAAAQPPQGFNPPPAAPEYAPPTSYPPYQSYGYQSAAPEGEYPPPAYQAQPLAAPRTVYEAPKETEKPYSAEPMSGRLKAFTILMLALIVACLGGFISVLVVSQPNTSNNNSETIDDNSFEIPAPSEYFNIPDNTQAATEGNYTESDAKDKTKPDYKGLKLKKRPKSAKKSGSSYAFNKVSKSVVAVVCYVDGQEGSETSYTSMGTGTIITAGGYLVTNSHIISDSRTAYKIKVITGDNKEYKAGVVGYDDRTDLAVLKIDASGLTPAVFGNSDDIKITEDVIAVGNPRSLKYQNSVTKGIVSAKNRSLTVMNNVKCIQTDAAINPGNSGGPLVNMYGQVIGINSAKIVLDDYEGMGFAIPSQTVKQIVDEIVKYNHVRDRVRIGIIGKVVYYGDHTRTGIQIDTINDGGPMDVEGVRRGDIITAMDGEKIETFADIYDELEKHRSGDKVKISLYRPDTCKSFDIEITLEEDQK